MSPLFVACECVDRFFSSKVRSRERCGQTDDLGTAGGVTPGYTMLCTVTRRVGIPRSVAWRDAASRGTVLGHNVAFRSQGRGTVHLRDLFPPEVHAP